MTSYIFVVVVVVVVVVVDKGTHDISFSCLFVCLFGCLVVWYLCNQMIDYGVL